MEKCFNSTLVQLKDGTFMHAQFEELCFNSTLVQLKGGFFFLFHCKN